MFMFVSSDRTWPPCVSKTLTLADGLLSSMPMDLCRQLRSLLANAGPATYPLGCGPKRRTFAATSDERNHVAQQYAAQHPPIMSVRVRDGIGDGGPADGLAVSCPRSLVSCRPLHNGPGSGILVGFRWRRSDQLPVAAGGSWRVLCWPGAPRSMRRRTPYPAGGSRR